MRNMLKFGLQTLFLLLVLLGAGTIYSIIQSQTYGRLINYVGIVRGATQRLVKMELAGQPRDVLVVYLDDILASHLVAAGIFNNCNLAVQLVQS